MFFPKICTTTKGYNETFTSFAHEPGQVRFCISAAHTIPQLREVSAEFFSAMSIVFNMGSVWSFTLKQNGLFLKMILFSCFASFFFHVFDAENMDRQTLKRGLAPLI